MPVGAGGAVAGRLVLEGVADGIDDALEVVGADLEGRHGIVPAPDLPRGEAAVVLGQLGGRLLEGGRPEGRAEGLALESPQVRAEEGAGGFGSVEQDGRSPAGLVVAVVVIIIVGILLISIGNRLLHERTKQRPVIFQRRPALQAGLFYG